MDNGISTEGILMVKEKKIKYSKSKQDAYRKLNDLVIGYIVDTQGFVSPKTGYVLQKNQYLDFYLSYDKATSTMGVHIRYSGMSVGAIKVQNNIWYYTPFSNFSSSSTYSLEPSLVNKLRSVLKSILNYSMKDEEVILTVDITYYSLFYCKIDKFGHYLEHGSSSYINLN